jgi:hypothetical protein
MEPEHPPAWPGRGCRRCRQFLLTARRPADLSGSLVVSPAACDARNGMFWLHAQRLRPDSGSTVVAEDPGTGVCMARDLHSVVDGALVRAMQISGVVVRGGHRVARTVLK